MSDSNL